MTIELTRSEMEAILTLLNQATVVGKDSLRLILGLIEKVETELGQPGGV